MVSSLIIYSCRTKSPKVISISFITIAIPFQLCFSKEQNMFLKASKPSPCTTPLCISAFRSRKPSRSGRKLQYLPLCRRRTTRDGILKKEMEIKNLKLYMVNKSIIEENQKLRKKAFLLNQENEALLFQLQNNFSKLSAPSQHQPCTSQ